MVPAALERLLSLDWTRLLFIRAHHYFSRDELKQWEMQQLYPEDKFPQLRFFLGDVRDRDRLRLAVQGVDTVIHDAALKQVPAAD